MPHLPVIHPSAWTRAQVHGRDDWIVRWPAEVLDEIRAAAQHVRAAGKAMPGFGRDDFRLPRSQAFLDSVMREVTHGRGFVLLRGFPVDLLAPDETELAYLALGLHLGTPVSQDGAGTLLGHVRDERVERTGPEVRLYRTRERQDFHTDGADIIGLLCLHGARSGGESKLASSYAVYNEILRRRPDLLDVLYEPMWWDRNGEERPGEDPAFPLPVLHDVDGVPRVFYIGWYIRDAQRHPHVPRLTAAQVEALDPIESVANDPAFHVEMDFRPGDVQLLNNAVILHSREAYEDDADIERRRHLLRLWLAAHDFTSVEDRLRTGIPS